MRSVNNEEQISAVKRLLVKYQIHRVSARAISKCNYYNYSPLPPALKYPFGICPVQINCTNDCTS